jgi:ribose transport system permease protein
MFSGWAPGTTQGWFPKGSGKFLPANAKFDLELHYTPTGSATTDQTEIGLYLLKEKPASHFESVPVVNTTFEIEPGDADSQVSATYGFTRPATLHSVAAQQAVTGIVALAILIPLAAGLYDLSVGATASLCGITSVVMMNDHHWAPVSAIAFGVAVAVAIGCLNSFIVVKLGVNSFIATLGMGSILSATQVIVSHNAQPLPPTSTGWNNFTQTDVGGFQIVVLYLLIIAFFLWWMTAHTPVGRYMYAIGGNAEAARLSGVRIERYTGLALVTSATIAGVAGIMFSSLNGPSLNFGGTLLLPAFAAAFLGSTQLIPGRFNVWGTLLAIYVLAVGVQGLQLVSGASWLNEMFNGVALIIAVALSIQRSPSAQWQKVKARFGRGSAGGQGPPGGVVQPEEVAPAATTGSSAVSGRN